MFNGMGHVGLVPATHRMKIPQRKPWQKQISNTVSG